MTRTTHATVGICSSYSLSMIMGVDPIYPVIIGVISSLLPDVDTGRSMINRLLIRIKLFQGKWMKLYYLGLFILLLIAFKLTENSVVGIICALCFLLVIGGHRTWFHSIFMIIPFTVIGNTTNLSTFLLTNGILNYTLHLLLDMLNPGGVMLLYPVSMKVFRFPVTFKSKSIITRVFEYSADTVLIYFTFCDAFNRFL